MKDCVALNPKVYGLSYQTREKINSISEEEKHEKMMKDKLIDIQVEKGKPEFYKAISKTGEATEEHELRFKNKKTLKGVSKAVVKNEITHQDYEKVHKDNKPIKKM